MEEKKKYYIFKDSRRGAPASYFLTISLIKTNNIIDYADVVRQDEIIQLERQEINPYFIELGFFDGIQRNKVNKGIELTPEKIRFIRLARPDVNSAFIYDDDIQKWFDVYGKDELPWGDITIDDIDKSDQTNSNIISKSTLYPIDINN